MTPSCSAISRRQFLGLAAAAAAGPLPLARALTPGAAAPIPIIDTHIHLFDPTRPQGVPWPEPKNRIMYRPALPDRFERLTAVWNVRGAIEVECSPWLEDNQWVLNQAEKNEIMVGTIGNLEPGTPDFPAQLARFRRNPLFRGIRCGNLWHRDLSVDFARPAYATDLARLADAGLALDVANPTPALLATVVRVTDRVPNLRVIVDHLPALARPQDPAPRAIYDAALRDLGGRPQVYVKVSEVIHGEPGKVARDLAPHRERIDEIFGVFGPDRVLYGSDWPNSDPLASYAEVQGLVREYFLAKGRATAEKYFWKNSVAAYRWVRRNARQPSL